MRGQQKRFEEAENIFYLFIGWRGRPPALEHQFGHAPDLQHAGEKTKELLTWEKFKRLYDRLVEKI